MIAVTNKLKLALCFTSTAVFIPKATWAQTDAQNWDSLNNASKAELPSNLSSENPVTPEAEVPAPIAEPETLAAQPELNSIPLPQTKVADLEQKINTAESCIPSNIGQPEFTKVIDLEQKKRLGKPCNPDHIGKPEFSSPELQPQPTVLELQTKQISPKLHSANNLPLVAELDKQATQEKPRDTSHKDPKYIIPPRGVDKKKVSPLTTTIPLNDTFINHLTGAEIITSASFGDAQNTNFNVNGVIKLNNQIEQNLSKDKILTLDLAGDYLQLRTVTKSREITVSLKEPQTLLGTELQLSLTASCIFPDKNPEDICTYTPGVATDRNSIDPDSLIPRQITQSSNLGEVLTAESLAAIQEPGYQNGVNSQAVGVDFFFPKTGALLGNRQGDKTTVTRSEEIQNTPVALYSTVRQIVKANDSEAVIGRTVRGFGLVLNDENTLLNSALQLGNLLLPDAIPQLKPGSKRKFNVNNNLFFAANNVRLPANSLTFYYAGIGKAKHPPENLQNLNQVPPGSFNGIWIGASPVIKRSYSINGRYETISPPEVIFTDGAEGGSSSNSDISFLSVVNDESFSTANLNNFYAQIYVKLFNQEANYITTIKHRETTNYVPHVSFTGNITGTKNIFQYYTGVIATEEMKAYLGVDINKSTGNGWTFSGGAIAYLNPDKDYYSNVLGGVSKTISLSRNANFVLSSGFNYAIDRDNHQNDTVNSLTFAAKANIGSISLGLLNYVGDVLPYSTENTLIADLAISLSDNFRISAYYTPINENSTRSRYGAGAVLKLGNNRNSPTLSVSWANNEYRLGSDPSGNELGFTDNVFTIFLRGNL